MIEPILGVLHKQEVKWMQEAIHSLMGGWVRWVWKDYAAHEQMKEIITKDDSKHKHKVCQTYQKCIHI